ncbi:MAG: hypothetical protein WD470_00505 [Rhodospirillaceae bacterium]
MADTPEIHELARRYLDLWQQHLVQMANDPEIGAAMAKLFATLQPPGFPQWPSASSHDPGENGAASPRAAPGGGGGDIGEFSARLAVLEERMADLERRPASRKSAERKPPERKPAEPSHSGSGRRVAGSTGKRKS